MVLAWRTCPHTLVTVLTVDICVVDRLLRMPPSVMYCIHLLVGFYFESFINCRVKKIRYRWAIPFLSQVLSVH